MLGFIASGSLIVKLVLLVLVLLSVASWAIIVMKHRQFNEISRANAEFWKAIEHVSEIDAQYRATSKLKTSNIAALLKDACTFLDQEKFFEQKHPHPEAEFTYKDRMEEEVNRQSREFVDQEVRRLEENLIYLATIGSTAPFIGLFGTVWGIMNSFRGIAQMGSASLAAVAPGIAESLVATAVGLFAAIPAAASYNFFIARIRLISGMLQKYARQLDMSVKQKSWTV
ncbi:MAG: MotA/TolQ/ExbB proton channel family protein [Nitrospirae bacterium]|nr:MotA/TolQ/ExbB proton channel family protein [Nitrospirota bacterium]